MRTPSNSPPLDVVPAKAKKEKTYDSFGAVMPIAFGAWGEASAGACDFVKSIAEAMDPDSPGRCAAFLDSSSTRSCGRPGLVAS